MPSTGIVIYQKSESRGIANDPTGFVKEFHIQPGDITTLAAAVEYDNCPVCYKEGYRSGANFIHTNAILADTDNSHSDNPADWITPEIVVARLPGLEFYNYPSRSHMKLKGDKAPRPKTHYIIPTDYITDANEYAAHMEWLIESFPELHFDTQVKSAAQLNFGVENPRVTYNVGSMNLSDYIKAQVGWNQPAMGQQKTNRKKNTIPEGKRNNHLSQFAGRVLKKYGNIDGKAYQAFMEEAAKCSPPLQATELSTIWHSAVGFYSQTIVTNPNYILPTQYSTNPSISELLIVDQSAFSTLCAPPSKERLFNIATARLFMKAYGLTLRINEMNRRADINGLPLKYGGEDAHNLLGILIADAANNLGYRRATNSIVHDALSVIANENRYHPVLELLNSAPWDGFDRKPEIFRMLGITNPFDMMLVHKWSLQTIAVLYNTPDNPIAAQGVLTFQGDQGLGKTEFFKHLAIRGEFFKEGTTLDMANKDSIMSAVKVWICELGELDSTTKKEQSAVKAFLTQQTDRFREPYARNETVRPRRTSFCGTVNPKGFLRDETGNRRYWVIHVDNVDLNAVFGYQPDWYTQFWRQMLYEYQYNPLGHLLTKHEQEMVNGNNVEFEAEVYGENEFMTLFDVTAHPKLWTWRTAAQIAHDINEEFKGLNLKSEGVGQRLIPRIEKRTGLKFERRRGTGGKRLIGCPPLNQNGWR